MTDTFKIPATPGKRAAAPVHQQRVKHTIGITSIKGGVGKSFITTYLALEFSRMGYQVGILDADFTGSCIPRFFGLQGPVRLGEKSFMPLESRTGIKVISMDLLVENEDQSIIWKEALKGKVIEELWKEVEWGLLDFLLIDLPSSSSEAAVATFQGLPFDGAILITTPQKIHLDYAEKARVFIEKSGVPVIGVIKNMSEYVCSETGDEHPLFAPLSENSDEQDLPGKYLAKIPFSPTVASLCDAGQIEELILEGSSSLVAPFLKALADVQNSRLAALKIAQETNDVPKSNEEQSPGPNNSEENVVCGSNNNPFSDTVMHLIHSRQNVGVLDKPDAQGFFLGKCGDRMQIDLKIINNRIIDARFVPEGCGATLACGSMLTKMACTKTIQEARKITPDELITALEGLPDDHLHCAELAVMTLREALIDAVEGLGKHRPGKSNPG